MRISRTLVLTCVGVAALLPVTTMACGESLFRVGKGVSYRNYFAPLPGNIIAVATTESEFAMLDQLKAAGHHVHVVASTDQISETLARHEHGFDLVLAYFSQRASVEAELADSGVGYLPITREQDGELALARTLYAESLASDESVKTYLRTIHRSLKARQA